MCAMYSFVIITVKTITHLCIMSQIIMVCDVVYPQRTSTLFCTLLPSPQLFTHKKSVNGQVPITKYIDDHITDLDGLYFCHECINYIVTRINTGLTPSMYQYIYKLLWWCSYIHVDPYILIWGFAYIYKHIRSILYI